MEWFNLDWVQNTRLSGPDLLVIVFYFVFMFAVGFVYQSFSKNSSDYFRGGGKMLWWMVGATAFMTQFSAWTFTGAAGEAYKTGTVVAMIFLGNAVGYFLHYFYTAIRFRRMRCVTPIEAVRERYGATNEQVFTWLQIPISVIYAGIWLNGLAVVAQAYLNIPAEPTIWIVGMVVLVMSVAGGSWAVAASDFVQLLILMSISIVLLFTTLALPEVGGISGFMEKIPEHHFEWNAVTGAQFVYIWAIAAVIQQSFKLNNMFDSYKYLSVKDESNAKKSALLAGILMVIGPIIWFIPPMAATIVEPDMASVFPDLKNASEGAYIYMGFLTLPAGMVGLLVCGLFAATMSSMDAGLNRNAGIFVRNFYHPVLRKHASEKELLFTGKTTTVAFGVIVILAALLISKTGMNLFRVMTLFGSLIAIPYAMPLVWGMFYKKTPKWSAWSTVLVGFVFSWVVTRVIDFRDFFGDALTDREVKDLVYIVSGVGNIVVCSIWFFATSVFYKDTGSTYNKHVDEFFEKQHAPVDFHKEQGGANDSRQSTVLGILCLIYAAFTLLLAVVIPNTLGDRMWYVFCASFMGIIGAALYYSGHKIKGTDDEELSDKTDG